MKAGDVLVEMVAAPITASDLSLVTGWAARGGGGGGAFQRVGGTEGIGVVREAGAESGLKVNTVVMVNNPTVGEERDTAG